MRSSKAKDVFQSMAGWPTCRHGERHNPESVGCWKCWAKYHRGFGFILMMIIGIVLFAVGAIIAMFPSGWPAYVSLAGTTLTALGLVLAVIYDI